VRTISQRELRNQNAEIAREVEQGETFEVQRHGKTAMYVIPPKIFESMNVDNEMKCTSRAKKRFDWGQGANKSTKLSDALSELRHLEDL